MENPTYLGDGAYARDGSYAGEIEIYTSDGRMEKNCVVLGINEVQAMVRFLAVRYDGLVGVIESAAREAKTDDELVAEAAADDVAE